MAYENLPGIFPLLIDGNLIVAQANQNPVVMVLGTSPRGDGGSVYNVASVSVAAQEFGKDDGTLVRGLYEVVAGGASNIKMLRIGAKYATLASVGVGLTIMTVEQDAGAGDNYSLFYEDSTKRLRVWRVSDDFLVYDNNPAYPSAAVDENEISVSGTASGSAGNIGTLASPLTMVQANAVSGAVYTAGSDGILLSRMELFEAIYKAYKLLDNETFDVTVPQNVYLDDVSICDLTTAQVTLRNAGAPWAAGSVYPARAEIGGFYDVLGEVFAQEYLGQWYFWWDMDRDGLAEIYPSVGASSASKDAYGKGLSASDFHEANFGYQLANFCYVQSENNAEMIGSVGVLPPNSWSLADVAAWIGKEPTYDENSNGDLVITTNGTGLLGGIKWMAGRLGNNSTGLPGHIVNYIDGLAYGGFIATDDGWPDGAQQYDRNGHMVDIGKYISVMGAQVITSNPTNATSYAATGSALYGGFVSSLAGNSAPTNKVIPGVRLPFRISVANLDRLAGMRYVMCNSKSKGNVIADAPTAARPDSDYRRLTTVRIVKACIDAIRSVGEPFLGEPITGARLAALETAIDQALLKLQKKEFIQRYDTLVTSTPTDQIQGKVNVELVLVPAFEMRQITINVALAAQ